MKKNSIKKRKQITALTAAVLAGAVLTGCTSNTASMVDDDAEAVESSTDISGNWVAPGRSFSIEFYEDGTVTEVEKLSETDGTYTFMSQNIAFTIADQFEEVEYISCADDDGDVFYTGAVLGDLISGYNETQQMERFYVKQDREDVPEGEIIGAWQDVNSTEYYAVIYEDGTLKTTDWEGTWEIGTSEEYGTSLTFHFEDYDEEYAVIRYEKYLFLYRDGTSNVYQLEPMEEEEAAETVSVSSDDAAEE